MGIDINNKEQLKGLFLSASNQLAKKWVFYMSKGKKCCRKYAIPYEPGTQKQKIRWNLFAAGMKEWRKLPVEEKSFYNNYVKKNNLKLHGVNYFLRLFLTGRI